jgi:DNA modification methylase
MSGPRRDLATGRILLGNAVERLGVLPEASVDCIVTSPPYFRLRDYGVEGQLGLEGHVDQWVEELRAVARALHRVLKPTGTFWLNLGDTYSTHHREGAPPKSLLGGPERLLLALVEDGWTVRNKIIWAKTNPMPSSVTDRLSTTHEYIYLLTKSPRYDFNLDAIREPHRSRPPKRRPESRPGKYAAGTPALGPNSDGDDGLRALKARGMVGHRLGKNPGDVWQSATAHYTDAHFATYPESLVRRIIRAGCPPGGIVLDPFMGAGTTAVVAEAEGRQWIGIELNPDFVTQAEARLARARAKQSEQVHRKEVT